MIRTYIKDKKLFSWALFDWANSPYPAVIQTFVFSAYYSRSIADDPISGASDWLWTMSAVGFFVAITAPLIGAVADKRGARKPIVAFFSLVCLVVSLLMWGVLPDASFAMQALVLGFFGSVAFELMTVFYNSMLPGLIDQKRFGSFSGFSWALGYFGTLLCIGLALFFLVIKGPSYFGFDVSSAEHIRSCFLFVGAWFLVFGVPMFIFTPDETRNQISILEATKTGLTEFRQTVKQVLKDKNLVCFFAGRMLFMDALLTVFSAAGVYTAGVYGMVEQELMVFAIAINLTSGLGALGFGFLEDRLGVKKVLQASVLGLTICTFFIVVSQLKIVFWIFGLLFGIFCGPAQSASRTFIAAYAPEEQRGQLFGMLAFSGKATAFVGPMLVAIVTDFTASQPIGLSVILPLFIAGFFLISKIQNPNHPPRPEELSEKAT